MQSYFKSILLFACFFQVLFELKSIELFLWPINYSCSPPKNLTKFSYGLEDSRKLMIDNDAVQMELIDATPENSFTLTRALVMGINYDDIARCYEYPIIATSNSSNQTQTDEKIDYEGLEPCKHGFEFGLKSNESLSIIAHFRLLCSDQWKQVLLPLALGVGFLIGALGIHSIEWLSATTIRVAASSQESTHLEVCGFLIWQLVQVLSNLWTHYCSYRLSIEGGLVRGSMINNSHLHEIREFQKDLFHVLLICVALRSMSLALNLTRILSSWHLSSQKNGTIMRKESQFYVEGFIMVYLFIQAIYPVPIFKLFATWWSLNAWLSIGNSIILIMISIRELSLICLYPMLNNHVKNIRVNHIAASLTVIEPNNQLEIRTTSSDEPSKGLNCAGILISVEENSSELPVTVDSDASIMKVCEVCLMNEDRPSTTHAVQMKQRGEGCRTSAVADLVAAVNATNSMNTYQQTTMPLGMCRLDSITCHNYGVIHRNLFRWPVLGQLWLLLFNCLLNYFMIQFLPDHSLLHSEETSSKYARKIHYNAEHYGNNTRAALGRNETSNRFDYSDVTHSTFIIEIWRESSNLIRIGFLTAVLNGWPILLLVILLHSERLSNFQRNYFKSNRLFSFIKFNSRLLLAEWFIVGKSATVALQNFNRSLLN